MADRPIGCDRERDQLVAALHAARTSKRALFVVGPPGIGKTALIEHAADLAVEEGFLTAPARTPIAGTGPHEPLLPLLEALRAGHRAHDMLAPALLHRAIEVLAGERPGTAVESVGALVAEALEACARRRPVALLLDDLHRAPDAGRTLLLAIAAMLQGPFAIVVGVRRTVDDDAEGIDVPATTADLPVSLLEIGGLDRASVGALAAARLGSPAVPSLVDRLMDLSAGNPLFVIEMLRAWLDAEVITPTGGYWRARGELPDMPASVGELIARRIAELEPEAAGVLRTIAVMRRPVSFEEARAAAHVDASRTIAAIERLLGGGAVVEVPTVPVTFALSHPVYEGAVLAGMGATERALVHQRVFETVVARGGRASEIADHAMRALEPPADLVDLVRAAASEADAASSRREAAAWWQRLADWVRDDTPALGRALEAQAVATASFDAREAVRLFSEALSLAREDADRARLLRLRSDAYRRASELGLAELDLRAVRDLAGSDTGLERALVQCRVRQGRVDALAELGAMHAGADPALALARLDDLSLIAYYEGRFADAEALIEAAIETGATDELIARGNAMWMRFLLGDWDVAVRDGNDLVARCERLGEMWPLVLPLATLARIHVHRGRTGLAIDLVMRAVRIAVRLGNRADLLEVLHSQVEVLLGAGDLAAAQEAAEQLIDTYDPGMERRPEYVLGFAAAAEAFVRAGRTRDALATCDRARGFEPAIGFDVALDRVEAQALVERRARADAIALLGRWVAEPSPLTFEQARVEQVLAEIMPRIERAEAGVHAARAKEAFESLDAQAFLPAVQRLVDRVGPRRMGRPKSNLPGELTPRELEVLKLVIQGFTNKQIGEALYLTTATAKKHVENVRKKAGVSRRTQLRDYARRLGILDAEGGFTI